MRELLVHDPRRLGDYALLGRLGRGAMGTVYLARSPGGRLVAVKVARGELAEDPDFRLRFRQEIEMARAVGGFWTAAVVGADPDADRPWLATEYVPGPTLTEAVRTGGPLPEPALRSLLAGLAEALAAIHGAGLVHRDLKPSNVLLAEDGPRVIDFGIAKAVRATALTATGVLFGTPGYLSPEQISGGEVGPPSDVFALGAVLVYAASGTGPFGNGEVASLLYRAVHTGPDLDGVPAELRPVVSRCLNSRPSARPTPADLLAEVGHGHTGQWLPPVVRTLVERHQTEFLKPTEPRTPTLVQPLEDRGRPTRASGGRPSASSVDAAPRSATPPLDGRPGASAAGDVVPRSPAPGVRPVAEGPSGGRLGVSAAGGVVSRPEAVGVRPVAEGPSGDRLGVSAADGVVSGSAAAAERSVAERPPGDRPGASPSGDVVPRRVAPGVRPAGKPGSAVDQLRLRTGRGVPLVWAVFAGAGVVVALGVAAKASRGEYNGLAAAAGVVAVLLGLSAVRSLFRVLVTRPRSVVVTASGLAISSKDGERVLTWPELSRVRVVTENSKPWLVVWPHTPDRTLGKRHTRRDGGFRVHPVSHHHGKRRQTQDIQNLRTALHRHAGKAYDPTP